MRILLLTLLLSGRALAGFDENPFASPSPLPFQLPPFDRIKEADYRPAFEEGMAEQRREVEAIAKSPEPATFDNTVVALERSGRLLSRVSKTFYNLSASNTDDEMQKIESEMAPKLSAHQDAIMMDSALFARVEEVYRKRESLGLDPESEQLLERTRKGFVRAGALLSEADKAKLKKINEDLSSLTTKFEQNNLKATKEAAVVVTDSAALAGLSPERVSAAALAAKERGLEGKWVLSIQNTTIQPPLEDMDDRALRERVYRASISRADGGPADNTAVVAQIAALRARQAALLGYKDFAAYALEDESAENPAAVNKMLSGLGRAALAKAKGEAADIQKLMGKTTLKPWDWAYYAKRAKKARFDFDEDQVKPYFELDRVLKDGVFYAAHELYGLSFKERFDLPLYRPDIRAFEVTDAHGTTLGLLLRDDFKRDNKNGGAWCNDYVDHAGLFGAKAVVVNNLNIPKPAEGQPVLLSFDEVTTMFHEFGHALHSLLMSVKYPSLVWDNTPSDFSEYPSQFNEMWAREPEILAHFAKHYKTGEPMPKALFAKVLAAQTYGQGFASLEYIEAAIIDQAWHQIPEKSAPNASGVMAFEAETLKKNGVSYGPVPPRYHTPYFAHPFSGGYAAGYYAYIWSEVLARDTGKWFHTHGGISRANGDFFRAKVLSHGRAMEPGPLFEQFYGAPPELGPLLEYRGLALPR